MIRKRIKPQINNGTREQVDPALAGTSFSLFPCFLANLFPYSRITTVVLLLYTLHFTLCTALHATPINLNTAMLNELTALPKISEKNAKDIIEYREKNKGFKNVDELENIIGAGKLKKLKKSVAIYAVSKSAWDTRITDNIDDLQKERLTVRTFSINGYSYYITFPDGKNMLIDTAKEEDFDKFAPLIKKENETIDFIVITNLSAERIGGLKKVLGNFKVKEFITSLSLEQLQKNTEFQSIINSVLLSNVKHTNITISSEREISGLKVTFLMPEYNPNNPSLCVLLNYNSVSFLFPSDIDDNLYNKMQLKADVLFSAKLKNVAGAKIFVQTNTDNYFTTDGYLICVTKTAGVNIPPPPPSQEQIQMEKLKAELELAKRQAENERIRAEEETRKRQQEEDLRKREEEKKKQKATSSPRLQSGVSEANKDKKEIPKSYIVSAGETLPSIAQKLYGDSAQWQKIYEANKDKIIQGQVQVGQTLVIP